MSSSFILFSTQTFKSRELVLREEGVPQGGNLRPSLSNTVLEKLGKELTRRGTTIFATRMIAMSKSRANGQGSSDGSSSRSIETELKN